MRLGLPASITFMFHLGLSNAATVRAGNALGLRNREHLVRGAQAAFALSLEDGALIFDVGELQSELQYLPGQGGQPGAYLFTDPPLAGPVPIMFQEGDGGQLEMVATMPGDYPGQEVTYVFTQVASPP